MTLKQSELEPLDKTAKGLYATTFSQFFIKIPSAVDVKLSAFLFIPAPLDSTHPLLLPLKLLEQGRDLFRYGWGTQL